MSLPAPAPRRHLHTRVISCEGYEREDGLFDIEARSRNPHFLDGCKAWASDGEMVQRVSPLHYRPRQAARALQEGER
jgi:hypothetical protein